jgi:hypothetical protein
MARRPPGNCMAEIRRRAGAQLTGDELEEFLLRIADMAQRGDPAQAMAGRLLAAANELAGQIRAAAAIERRNRIQNLQRRGARREFYLSAPAVGRTAGPLIGLEAKLVGVNTPFAGARQSVDAEGNALIRDLVDGFSIDLERAGHFEAFRSGAYDRQVAIELFELNRREVGQPGTPAHVSPRTLLNGPAAPPVPALPIEPDLDYELKELTRRLAERGREIAAGEM